MKTTIAIDIGGTQMRAASYSLDHTEPVKINRIATRGEGQTIEERLTNLIQSVWPKKKDAEVLSIAAASPGPLNPKKGLVLETPNIPEWRDFPLRAHIKDHFHVPTQIGNDANLAALGEWKFGAGIGHENLIYLTISTGIGGGIISEGKLLSGVNGMGGELGHVTVLPDGPLCGCGQRGHLEAVASGPSITRWVKGQLEAGKSSRLRGSEDLTAEKIAQVADGGDELARNAFQRAGVFIGHAIADYLHIFNPSLVVIGGGVSQAGALLFNPIQASIPERLMSPAYLEDVQITKAKLGDDVGLMGALALSRDMLS
jgi:glucokinase